MSAGQRAAVAGFLVLLSLGVVPVVRGFEAEVDVQARHSAVTVATGPATVQEYGVDRVLTQATVGHRQSLLPGLSVEGTGWASLDTLPSGSSQVLPVQKLEFASKVLEAWLGWEPLPGTLTLGAGKRVLHPSSGFSHTPLNFLDRGGETSGARATSSWEEGWTGAQVAGFWDALSTSVFAAPALGWVGQSDAFVQGRAGLSLGSSDLQTVVLRRGEVTRGGLGLDTGWGDSLTLRAEAAADANLDHPRADTLAGVTWTGSDQSSVMAEVSWDGRGSAPVTDGFLRVSGTLEDKLTGEVWVKVDLGDASGWTGTALTWTASKWSLGASWLGSWGAAGTSAGDNALRWRTTVEAKTFW